jgi:hypothetical protein
MNFVQLRRKLSQGMLVCVVASSVLLVSCGGGGGGSGSSQSAGIGGTGIAAGKTTGFGSIYVNGSEYNTDASQFIVDGESFPDQTAANLQIGMFVKLRVKTLDGNLTGTALEVVYDDEVQGPVSAISTPGAGDTQRTFNVFGQNVTVDEITTIFNGTTFLGLSNNDVVEISGFRTSSNDITATYVEDKGNISPGSEVELRGTISGYTPPTEEFMLDGVLIRFDSSATDIEVPNGVLDNGLFVEVEGTYQTVPVVRIDADEIEFEDEEFGDDIDEISLQGIISTYNSIANFVIDGLVIDASGVGLSVEEENQLGVGVEVEVEGDIIGSMLIADELEFRAGDSELRTTIKDIDPILKRLELEYPGQPMGAGLGTIWVNTDGQTLFEDESAANLPNLLFGQLAIGDFVKVKGIANLTEVNAEIVKRKDPDSTKLEGLVEAKDDLVSITILGITYPVDPAATYEDENGMLMNATDFFDAIVIDSSIVELEDDDPADADADEIEFDD